MVHPRRVHRRHAILVCAAAALGALASQALAGEREPPGPERTIHRNGEAFTVREVSVAWQLADVGRRGRTLKLFYESGGCGHDNGRAKVEEGRTTIEIGVRQDETTGIVGEENFGCTDDLRTPPLRVRLSRPVGVVGSKADREWGHTRDAQAASVNSQTDICNGSCQTRWGSRPVTRLTSSATKGSGRGLRVMPKVVW